MKATHRNKPLERINTILYLINDKIKKNPEEEVFLIDLKEFSDFDSLLSDKDLLEISFDEINKESDGALKIELRATSVPGSISATRKDSYQVMFEVWFYIANHKKLNEYRNQIIQKLEKDKSRVNFILDSNGNFYQEGAKEKNKCKLKKNSARYRLIHFLALQTSPVKVNDLAIATSMTPDEVRGKVAEVRDILVKKMKLPRDSMFENRSDGSGYQITNITLKGS